MLHPARSTRAAVALAVASMVGGVTAGAIAASGGGRADSGTAYIGPTAKQSKSLFYDAGYDVDKVLGASAVLYTIKPLANTNTGTITAKAQKVTLFTSTGSLSGSGTATLKITNKPKSGDATVSGGKLNLNHGTGGQAGHSLVATFTGQGNTLSGLYVFHYQGTYK